MECKICKQEFKKNSNHQKYCKICSINYFKGYNKKYSKRYWQKFDVKLKHRVMSKEYNNRPETKERQKLWLGKNKEMLKQKKQLYYQKNKISLSTKMKKWREENRDRKKNMDIAYYQQNKEKIRLQKQKPEVKKRKREYEQKKFNSDSNFRIARITRKFINHSLMRFKAIKSAKAITLIGCSFPELRQYLEKQFKEGMSWGNYGINGWHIDHLRPCASFDLSKPEEQQKCFHYTNLQPMWASENFSKSDKYDLSVLSNELPIIWRRLINFRKVELIEDK